MGPVHGSRDGADSSHERNPRAGYSVAIATFRRPDSLLRVLSSVAAQVSAPQLIVVADNDPDVGARDVVARWARSVPCEVRYVSTGANLGPAGGWAFAAAEAGSHDQRGDWLLVLDDDDPLSHPAVVDELLRVAGTTNDRCAAIGLRGSRLLRRRARLRRAVGPEGSVAEVDYLASNGAPLYRWTAIDEVGFFDAALFFGFEDLDLGLRLRLQGWSVVAAALPSLGDVNDSAAGRTPWREYYKTRALVVIMGRYGGRVAVGSVLLRTVAAGSLRLAMTGNRGVAQARFAGARDGLRGRMGEAGWSPSSNQPKVVGRP